MRIAGPIGGLASVQPSDLALREALTTVENCNSNPARTILMFALRELLERREADGRDQAALDFLHSTTLINVEAQGWTGSRNCSIYGDYHRFVAWRKAHDGFINRNVAPTEADTRLARAIFDEFSGKAMHASQWSLDRLSEVVRDARKGGK